MAPGRKKEDATGAVHELAGKGVLVIYATPSNEHILASIFAQVRPPRNFFMIRQCDCLSAPIFLAGNCSRQYPMQQMPPASADTTLAFDVVPKLESSLCFHNETIVEDQNKSLARELATLANDERQAILEEVHGVCAPIVEEFEFLTSKQRELTVEVTKIQRKTAYNRARFLCPQFVNDPRLLSQFLRADGFDTKEAAKRLIRFFETKQYLWGEEALVKRITLDDLTRYDIAAMQAGAFRVTLPDRAGRPLMLLVVKSLNYRTIKDQLRAQWYQIMAALEDEGTQRRGLVEIVWHLSPCSGRHNTHLRLFRAMSTLLSSLPWRCAAVHYCYDQQLPRAPMALFRPNSGTINCQHRFRAHKGSTEECLRNLRGYGIHPALLSSVNERLPEPIENYLEIRQWQEAAMAQRKECNMIWCPGPTDVLLGRGKPYQEYLGNRIMNEYIVEELARNREAENPIESMVIVDRVLKTLKSRNVRFLKRLSESDGWFVASEAAARDKVYFALRVQVRKAGNEAHFVASGESDTEK